MPVSEGRCLKSSITASSPPEDAPMATIRREFSFLSFSAEVSSFLVDFFFNILTFDLRGCGVEYKFIAHRLSGVFEQQAKYLAYTSG